MKIKPCPKCGSDDIKFDIYTAKGVTCTHDEIELGNLLCRDCGTCGATYGKYDEQSAIIQWNMLSDYMHEEGDDKVNCEDRSLSIEIHNIKYDVSELKKDIERQKISTSIYDNYYKLEDRVSELENSAGDKSSPLDHLHGLVEYKCRKCELEFYSGQDQPICPCGEPFNIPFPTEEQLYHQSHITNTYNEMYENNVQIKPVNEACLGKEIILGCEHSSKEYRVTLVSIFIRFAPLIDEVVFKELIGFSAESGTIKGYYSKRCPDVEYNDN